MRVLLFTGKGGVGKTTASAATAAATAARGRKTLVLSTDPAHSLADALQVPLGGTPTEVEPGLYGMQVDAQAAFERTWREVQSYLVGTSAVQKSQVGSYALASRAGGTEVTYSLSVDIAMPMLGMFKRKAEKMIMDSALKELKKRVESRA